MWEAARSQIDRELHARINEGVEVWKADLVQTGATVRYVQQCLWVHLPPGVEPFAGAFAAWREPALEDIIAWPASRHWLEALRAAWASLKERDPTENEASLRAYVLGMLGSALAQARQTAEAVTVHRQKVALSRALSGLVEGASDDDIRARVRDHAGAVRELCIGLIRLSTASNGNEQQTVHGEAKRLALLLAEVRPEAAADLLQAFGLPMPGA